MFMLNKISESESESESESTYCNCNNCRDIFINLFSDHVFSWNADKYIKILTTPNTQSAPKFIEKKNGIFKYT